jgi:hypothetical protein
LRSTEYTSYNPSCATPATSDADAARRIGAKYVIRATGNGHVDPRYGAFSSAAAWVVPAVWSTSGPDVYSARVETPTALVVRINLPLAGLRPLHTDVDRRTERERERYGTEEED